MTPHPPHLPHLAADFLATANLPALHPAPHAESRQIHMLASSLGLDNPVHASPFVYQAFPEMLHPIGSVSQERLRATRMQRWTERALLIHDDAASWLLCVWEWRMADQEVEAESDLERKAWLAEGIEMYIHAADRELLNLAR